MLAFLFFVVVVTAFELLRATSCAVATDTAFTVGHDGKNVLLCCFDEKTLGTFTLYCHLLVKSEKCSTCKILDSMSKIQIPFKLMNFRVTKTIFKFF